MVTLGGGNDRKKTEGELLGAGDVVILSSAYTGVFGLQRLVDFVLHCMYIIL